MHLLRVNHSKKAFSLMEVLILIVVFGTITLMSISSFIIFSEKTKSAEGKHILISLLGAQKRWSLDHNGAYTDTLDNLDVIIPQSGSFCTPIVKISDPIVSIKRKGSGDDGGDDEDCDIGGGCGLNPLYTLTINSNGTISCQDGGSNLCSQINY